LQKDKEGKMDKAVFLSFHYSWEFLWLSLNRNIEVEGSDDKRQCHQPPEIQRKVKKKVIMGLRVQADNDQCIANCRFQ
jgi:hypothetical protein